MAGAVEDVNMNEKDFEKLAEERRTVHSYIKKDVPLDIIEAGVRLSLWAPNHRLSFPWKYFLISEEKQKNIFQWACENKKLDPNGLSPLTEATKEQFLYPKILVLGLKKDANPAMQKEDYATLSCSVQILSMYFWQHGLGTKWSTGKVSRDPRLYSLVGAAENEVSLEGMLIIGWAKEIPQAAERPALESVFKTV